MTSLTTDLVWVVVLHIKAIKIQQDYSIILVETW